MQGALKLTYEDPRSLRKNTWNPNKMSPEAESKLRNSIQKNGHVKPVIVRELDDGTLEIVGGEHRVDVSVDLGLETIPVVNLGKISDEQAKKALLIDNSRYGEDDAASLSALLEDIGTADELAEWTTYTSDDLAVLLNTSSSDDLSYLDELNGLDDEDGELPAVAVPEVQTHQTMKFKVPAEDAHTIKDVIDSITKVQKLEDSDSAVRAGDALLWLIRDYQARVGADQEVYDAFPNGTDATLDDFLSTLEEQK